mmetsp:Transcript_9717/g.16364  ORF Transcript_9717/g.16364 Transcript_9717/m.16364 type:complete len:124 (+) Transcript_9717:26-397(+)
MASSQQVRCFSSKASPAIKQQDLKGFRRMTEGWIQRQAMFKAIEIQRQQELQVQKNLLSRFADFWMVKKRRVAYMLILFLIYYYDAFNRFVKWQRRFRESMREKYALRWAYKYNPVLASLKRD